MSADNRLIIGKFKDGYRIANNVSASVNYLTKEDIILNKEDFEDKIYDEKSAWQRAIELEDNYEYGIQEVEYDFEFPK